MPNNGSSPEQFQPREVATDIMDGAAKGDGLESEFRELSNNLSPEQQSQVLDEMRGMAGTEGYEDVHFSRDGSIVFNPNGESIGDNETRWQYSSDSRTLWGSRGTQAADRVNTIDGQLDNIKPPEPAADAGQPETSDAPDSEPPTAEEVVLGDYDTPEGLAAEARRKGREDLIDTSKQVAADLMEGNDVYPHFQGENATNQRLLWKLAQSEMLQHLGDDGSVTRTVGQDSTHLMWEMNDGNTKILMEQSNLGSPRDALVNDSDGWLGTGFLGTSVGASAEDAFVTPQDRANADSQPTWADRASDAFYDTLKGENWDEDIASMREQMRELRENPDSPRSRELLEKLKDNGKVIMYDAKAHGE